MTCCSYDTSDTGTSTSTCPEGAYYDSSWSTCYAFDSTERAMKAAVRHCDSNYYGELNAFWSDVKIQGVVDQINAGETFHNRD